MKAYIGSNEIKGLAFHVATGDIKDAATTPDKVLAPNVFYGNDGRQVGTMPNRGGMSAELAAGGSVSIPEGYHNGEGVVRAQDLASQTAGTMTAETLSVGETGWVNGKQITGRLVVPAVNDWDPKEMEENIMLDLSGYTGYLWMNADNSQTIPAGTYILCCRHASTTASTQQIRMYDNKNQYWYFPLPTNGADYFKITTKEQYTLVNPSNFNTMVWKKN